VTYNSPIVSTEGSDDSHDEPFVAVADGKTEPKLAAADDNVPAEEWF
jgi:hypothetical protein